MMKLKIFGTAVFLVAICIFLGNQKKVSNDIFLSNIEALAEGESGIGGCIGVGSVSCPFHWNKVYYASTR